MDVKYGSEFSQPTKLEKRLERAKKGERMFEPPELQALIGAASQPLRTMILLGLNAGMGNKDCAMLPIDAVDLKRGWIVFPRGLVTLPVPSDPKDAFNHISRSRDVGWLVVAPGLEDGEQRDEVGYIVRGSHESRGECTPTLLLYSTNEV